MAENNQEEEQASQTPEGGNPDRASRESESPTPASESQKLPSPENSKEERFTWRMLWTGVLSFFQLEKGLLRTFRDLILRPGMMIRSYLFTKERARYTNPIGFILLSSALVAFLMFRYGDYDAFAEASLDRGNEIAENTGDHGQTPLLTEQSDAKATTADSTYPVNIQRDSTGIRLAAPDTLAVDSVALAEEREAKKEAIVTDVMGVYSTLMAKYYNIMMLIGIPMFAWWTWIFFRQDRFHFAEHMVVNAYILSMQNFLFLPVAPFMFTTKIASIAYMVTSFIYQVYAYSTVFSGPTGIRTVRSVLVTIFSMASYFIVLAILMAGLALLIVLPKLS